MAAGLNEMVVESVRVHMLSSQHVVILRDAVRERYLPIWIGPWEANAIAMRLQGVTPERPMTHDLFSRRSSELGVTIKQIVVSDLADDTFRARLLLELDGRRSTSTRGRAMRSPWPSGRRADLRHRRGARSGGGRARERGGGEAVGLPRLRQLARVRPARRGEPEASARRLDWRPVGARPPSAASSTGSPRSSAEPRRSHSRRRSRQKSRTARSTTFGLAPVGLPAVRG
jgi:hypothetical protein